MDMLSYQRSFLKSKYEEHVESFEIKEVIGVKVVYRRQLTLARNETITTENTLN